MIPSVIGVYGSSVYAFVSVAAVDPCPPAPSGTTTPAGTQDSSGVTNCFYYSTSVAPENWSYLGQFSTSDGTAAIEVIFGPGACHGTFYKFIYTTGKVCSVGVTCPGVHIFRAPYDPNKPNDLTAWTPPPNGAFADVIPSNIPSDTIAKVGVLAAGNNGGQTTLFYGNYNGGAGPSTDNGGSVWQSGDCGQTWTSQNLGSSEVHAIEVDPKNSQNIYANIDGEGTAETAFGLYRCCDINGNFNLVSNGGAIPAPFTKSIGIDFVFPDFTNSIFMEADGPLAGPGSVTGSNTGPMVWWDGVSGDTINAVPWPNTSPGEPPWDTSVLGAGGIKLTSEQNIFLFSTSLMNPNLKDPNALTLSNFRNGIWYFAPPSYNAAILLEDSAPPIQTISLNNGAATVTTFEPFTEQLDSNLQEDNLTITLAQPACFDVNISPFPTPTQENQFVYASTCTTPYTGGGFAKKQNPNFQFFGRTAEIMNPTAPNASYLYNTAVRFVKPRFVARLSAFATPSGEQHWTYFDAAQHLHNLWSGTIFGNDDVTAITGALPAAAGSDLAGFADATGGQHWVYLDANEHLHDLSWSAGIYSDSDVTAFTNAPTAAPGSAIAGFITSSGELHWTYFDVNLHVHNLWKGTIYGDHDVTAITGAVLPPQCKDLAGFVASGALPNSPCSDLAGFADATGGQHWVYLDANEHLHDLSWFAGIYSDSDVTALASAPTAAPGSAVTGFTSSGQTHWAYFDGNQHLHNLWLGTSYGNHDVTELTGSNPAVPGSDLVGFTDPNGIQHWIYLDNQLQLHNSRWLNGYGDDNLMQKISNAHAAVAGSEVAGFSSNGVLYWSYLDSIDHLHSLSLTNGVYRDDDVTAITGAPIAH